MAVSATSPHGVDDVMTKLHELLSELASKGFAVSSLPSIAVSIGEGNRCFVLQEQRIVETTGVDRSLYEAAQVRVAFVDQAALINVFNEVSDNQTAAVQSIFWAGTWGGADFTISGAHHLVPLALQVLKGLPQVMPESEAGARVEPAASSAQSPSAPLQQLQQQLEQLQQLQPLQPIGLEAAIAATAGKWRQLSQSAQTLWPSSTASTLLVCGAGAALLAGFSYFALAAGTVKASMVMVPWVPPLANEDVTAPAPDMDAQSSGARSVELPESSAAA